MLTPNRRIKKAAKECDSVKLTHLVNNACLRYAKRHETVGRKLKAERVFRRHLRDWIRQHTFCRLIPDWYGVVAAHKRSYNAPHQRMEADRIENERKNRSYKIVDAFRIVTETMMDEFK